MNLHLRLSVIVDTWFEHLLFMWILLTFLIFYAKNIIKNEFEPSIYDDRQTKMEMFHFDSQEIFVLFLF